MAAGITQRDMDDLLPLALSRPHEALTRAQTILAERPSPAGAAIAHQAAGIVLRDIGDIGAALRELRAALRAARRAGSPEREADVLATLGLTLAYARRTPDALAAFEQSLRLSSGAASGRVLHRRGLALWRLGRYAAALEDLRRAVDVLRRAGDPIWTSRALTARGMVYLAVGSPGRADADFVTAERLYAETGQELESVHTVLNRASAAFALGDLPAALSHLDEAAARYRPLNVPTPFLSIDRCAVLLAAGLVDDALDGADAAVRDIEQFRGQAYWRAELLLMAANCALAAGQPQAAVDRAGAAYRLFRAQQSAWWQAQAGLVLARARYRIGPPSAQGLRAAGRVAARLDRVGAGEATLAHLLAGRIALDLGRADDADQHLRAAAERRRRGPPMSRASGWLAEALRAQAAADPGRLFAACRRGLDLLDEHRFTLGASELRAQATAHGAELAALAQRHAAAAHRPRLLLAWAERWRATALRVPAVRPPADTELSASLAALRRVTGEVQEARRSGEPPAGLVREQRRLENVVRACTLRTRGTTGGGHSTVSIRQLIQALGAVQLIEIVDIDGVLHVLTCRDGRVRQFAAGRPSDATRAAELAGFALRRLARARPGADPASALAILDGTAPELQDALLGPAAGHLGDGPAVIVPPSRLHSIPWALLPALRDRVFSVAPSAGAWLRAHTSAPPPGRPVTLARGPGLATEGAEVPLIAPLYAHATVLSGGQATAGRVLTALDGAWLAHIAAHGSFRADSPLFSSLRLHDGPLTVYDFEQLHRAPYRLVLPSCDSGVVAPAGADELLGLVSSILPLGTAGVVASVAPLNDRAAVPLMLDLHQRLSSGATLAESLCAVRRRVSDDPVLLAAAWSLVALGAG
jgi:tetratricopeptide (TPR) repeat protein